MVTAVPAKHRAYLLSIGKGVTVRGEEMQVALEHLRDLHRRGMSVLAMERQSGMFQSQLSDMVRGFRTRPGYPDDKRPMQFMYRTTMEKILAITFEPPGSTPGPTNSIGAKIDACGVRRRLQALAYAGFPARVITEYLGLKSKQWVVENTSGERSPEFSRSGTLERIKSVYEKLAYADPRDFGIGAVSIGKVKGSAKRNGYAPAHCWDDDTIDDPNAVPEWTGACGSLKGYHLHYRHDIMPVCGPCKEAKSVYNAERRAGLHDRDAAAVIRDMAIDELMDEGMSRADICTQLSISLKTVERRVKARNGGQ